MIEQKLFELGECKFASTDDATRSFSGYGAVFGNVDSYGDMLVPGSFKRTLAEAKKANATPLMFLNHDMHSLPIGRWTAMSEDDFGLKVEGHFLDTQAGRDAYTAAKANAISGLSIGYRAHDIVMGKNVDEPRRTLKSVDLFEVSLVTFPANTSARVQSVKSMLSEADPETVLINLGMSLDEAKAFLATVQQTVEAKYHDAAVEVAARNLLLKLQGD